MISNYTIFNENALYYLLIKPINICRVKFRITALPSY